MLMLDPHIDWNGSTLTVRSSLIPKMLWQTASIDAFLDGKCILKTGGKLNVIGSHSAQFEHVGHTREATLSWGLPGFRSFPIEVKIDGQSILKSRVFIRNWPLAYCPWIVFAALVLYGIFKQ